MKEFSSIGQFRNVVSTVNHRSTVSGRPTPTLHFTGRVKLHGSNASFRFDGNGEFHTYSRTRIIDPTNDNAGFASWGHTHINELRHHFVELFGHRDIQVFGEWCGGNMQKGVALNQCPRHLVVFGAWDHDNKQYLDVEYIKDLRDHSISLYNITEIPPVHITIDFTAPHLVQDQIADIVDRYEAQCPWSSQVFGVDGVGEGVVFMCDEYPGDSDLWFKAKGDAHSKGAKRTRVKVVADVEKHNSIVTLVDSLLPNWRLEQGLTEIAPSEGCLDAGFTGAYLKWVCSDVLKEEGDTITASGFDWKREVSPIITSRARNHFFTHLNIINGLAPSLD